jgi:1,4-dihydroxy-6-naphthoate synthase
LNTPEKQLIRVGHSPDPDDAFMFFALAADRLDTGRYRFQHDLVDIEALNRRALDGELELTAVSLHAYAYLQEKYLLCNCGASMGDRYGPMVVSRRGMTLEHLRDRVIAVPGTLTTAYLTLRMCLGSGFQHVLVPFDQILDATAEGNFEGQPIDAGLVIHEGQLTYAQQDLQLLIDLGHWWYDQTGLPLPLGANALRKDLGDQTIREVETLLHASIRYGLEHRQEALQHALQFGRGLNRDSADQFVGMYVNQWTLDFGPRGRQAVAELLRRGHAAGVIDRLIVPEFVGLP